jgi:hypothetical protein
VRLPIGLRNQTVTQKTLAPGKSLDPLLYLMSAGLIATWTICVFFGVGFFFLMHQSERPTSGLAVDSPDVSVSFAESSSPEVMSSAPEHASQRDPTENSETRAAERLLPALLPVQSAKPPQQIGEEAQPDVGEAAESGMGETAIERGAPPVNLETVPRADGELAPMPPPRNPPSSATGAPRVAQSPHSASSRERPQRPPKVRATEPHAPVQAIQDVIQKHSRLFK